MREPAAPLHQLAPHEVKGRGSAAHGLGPDDEPGPGELRQGTSVCLLGTQIAVARSRVCWPAEEVEMTFVRRLRDELRFETAQDLIEQIGRDVEATRQALRYTSA